MAKLTKRGELTKMLSSDLRKEVRHIDKENKQNVSSEEQDSEDEFDLSYSSADSLGFSSSGSSLSSLSLSGEWAENDVFLEEDEKNAILDTSQSYIHFVTIEDFDEIYTVQSTLGKGSFATVKKGIKNSTGEEFALKIVSKNKLDPELSKKQKDCFFREISVMKELDHPNIVKLYEVFETSEKIILVLELMKGGPLFNIVEISGHYNENSAGRIIQQITQALNYLHSKSIVHRDIKAKNLLLADKTENTVVKVADFGLSNILSRQNFFRLKTPCGTPGYVAPEVLLAREYDEKVDIWSLGVLTYVLLCGKPPFQSADVVTVIKKTISGKYKFFSPFWDPISENAKNFISNTLKKKTNKRFSAEQCLQHKFLTTLNESSPGLPWIGYALKHKKIHRRILSRTIRNLKKFGVSENSEDQKTVEDTKDENSKNKDESKNEKKNLKGKIINSPNTFTKKFKRKKKNKNMTL